MQGHRDCQDSSSHFVHLHKVKQVKLYQQWKQGMVLHEVLHEVVQLSLALLNLILLLLFQRYYLLKGANNPQPCYLWS